MERLIPEQVQPTTWGVGERLKDFIDRQIRVKGMVQNIKRLRDPTTLPDERTVPYEPLASVTIRKCWPDGLVVVSNADEDVDRGSSTTITGFWDDDGKVVSIMAVAKEFSDGEVVGTRSWAYDHLKGIKESGIRTSQAASVLAKATSVLLKSVRTPALDPEESY